MGGAGGTIVGSTTFNPAYDVLAFFGVASTILFDRVEIRDLTGTIDDEYFGQFYTAEVLAPIPLPAALPLFGTGLGILGFLGWRRRRKAV